MDKHDYEARLAAEVKKLDEYRKAIEEEMRSTSDPDNTDANKPNKEELLEQADDEITRLIPAAVAKLAFLLEHAEKDTTQFATAKYILDRTSGKNPLVDEKEDPLEVLISQLTSKDGKKSKK